MKVPQRYSKIKVIGKGSFGEVFLVSKQDDRRLYVCKKISLRHASDKERDAAKLEVKLLADLRHPHIVAYKDSFQDRMGFLYIVMAYCEGGDLFRRLRQHEEKRTLLPESQIVRWFAQIAIALDYMHGKNILHRDLKSQNIFLTRNDVVKVGDLGIARQLKDGESLAQTRIGTPYYMSPELLDGKGYNHTSDIWALGCLLYEMASLVHPFKSPTYEVLVQRIHSGVINPLPKIYSKKLMELAKEMIQQNQNLRPTIPEMLKRPFIVTEIEAMVKETAPPSSPSGSNPDSRSGTPTAEKQAAESPRTSTRSSREQLHRIGTSKPDSTKPPRESRAGDRKKSSGEERRTASPRTTTKASQQASGNGAEPVRNVGDGANVVAAASDALSDAQKVLEQHQQRRRERDQRAEIRRQAAQALGAQGAGDGSSATSARASTRSMRTPSGGNNNVAVPAWTSVASSETRPVVSAADGATDMSLAQQMRNLTLQGGSNNSLNQAPVSPRASASLIKQRKAGSVPRKRITLNPDAEHGARDAFGDGESASDLTVDVKGTPMARASKYSSKTGSHESLHSGFKSYAPPSVDPSLNPDQRGARHTSPPRTFEAAPVRSHRDYDHREYEQRDYDHGEYDTHSSSGGSVSGGSSSINDSGFGGSGDGRSEGPEDAAANPNCGSLTERHSKLKKYLVKVLGGRETFQHAYSAIKADVEYHHHRHDGDDGAEEDTVTKMIIEKRFNTPTLKNMASQSTLSKRIIPAFEQLLFIEDALGP